MTEKKWRVQPSGYRGMPEKGKVGVGKSEGEIVKVGSRNPWEEAEGGTEVETGRGRPIMMKSPNSGRCHHTYVERD